jgi:hypothetical protein
MIHARIGSAAVVAMTGTGNAPTIAVGIGRKAWIALAAITAFHPSHGRLCESSRRVLLQHWAPCRCAGRGVKMCRAWRS